MQADGEDRDQDDADHERRHDRDEGGEGRDGPVDRRALPQTRERAEREPERDADHQGQSGDRQADHRSLEELVGDRLAVAPAPAQVAAEQRGEPVDVLDVDRPVQAPVVLQRGDRLGRRRLTELQPGWAQPTE